MAVAVVSSAGGGVHNNATASATLDMTGVEFVYAVSVEHAGTTTGVSMTVGGNAATELIAATANDSAVARLWRYNNVVGGLTGNQTVALTGSDASIRAAFRAVGFSGVDSATPNGTAVATTTATPATDYSLAMTLSSADAMGFGGIGYREVAAISARGAGQTDRGEGSGGTSTNGAVTANADTATDGDGFDDEWNFTLNASQGAGVVAVVINASGGGGGGAAPSPYYMTYYRSIVTNDN